MARSSVSILWILPLIFIFWKKDTNKDIDIYGRIVEESPSKHTKVDDGTRHYLEVLLSKLVQQVYIGFRRMEQRR